VKLGAVTAAVELTLLSNNDERHTISISSSSSNNSDSVALPLFSIPDAISKRAICAVYPSVCRCNYEWCRNGQTCRQSFGSKRTLLLSPHVMRRRRLLLFLVTLSTKLTTFGSRYFVDGLSERDEIWQIDREGLTVYVRIKIGELWPRESLCGTKILKAVKNCNTFLIHRWAERDEIWQR